MSSNHFSISSDSVFSTIMYIFKIALYIMKMEITDFRVYQTKYKVT